MQPLPAHLDLQNRRSRVHSACPKEVFSWGNEVPVANIQKSLLMAHRILSEYVGVFNLQSNTERTIRNLKLNRKVGFWGVSLFSVYCQRSDCGQESKQQEEIAPADAIVPRWMIVLNSHRLESLQYHTSFSFADLIVSKSIV